MARAYSDDLRQKLIEAHQQGDGSLPALHQRVHVREGWAAKGAVAGDRGGRWRRSARSFETTAAEPVGSTPVTRSSISPFIQTATRFPGDGRINAA